MASAALRCACASVPVRPTAPLGRRCIAAALAAGAAAAWNPKAFAEPLDQKAHAQVVPSKEGGAPGGPPGQHPAVGDGLDEVRQRIRQYGLSYATRSEEDKLNSLLRQLQAQERGFLQSFEEAEAEGDDEMMRVFQRFWQETSEKLELLKANPREFVRKYGAQYGITAG